MHISSNMAFSPYTIIVEMYYVASLNPASSARSMQPAIHSLQSNQVRAPYFIKWQLSHLKIIPSLLISLFCQVFHRGLWHSLIISKKIAS